MSVVHLHSVLVWLDCLRGSGTDGLCLLQVVKVQETRQLLTSLCGSATSAGVRTTMYCMRDIIAESPQTFIVIMALLVALPMYLATRHVLQVIP